MELQQLTSRYQRRWKTAGAVFFGILALLFILSLCVGEEWINPFSPSSELHRLLLSELRLPRVIAVMVIGASLAACGATLQVLLGNPLAEPGILGVSGGASLLVTMLMIGLPWLVSPAMIMLFAMLGALLFTMMLVGFCSWKRLSTSHMLLVGIALGILGNAVVTWLFYFSNDMNLRQLLYWLMGSVSGVNWSQLQLLWLVLPSLIFLLTKYKTLDALMHGDIAAQQLGIDVHKERTVLILVVAILVGGSVALAGIIGFIGLVIPHLLRLAFGAEHRYLLPLSSICGAALLMLADMLSRTLLNSGELPIGVLTASMGAPVFIWLLLREGGHE